jgi:hypothetical protein
MRITAVAETRYSPFISNRTGDVKQTASIPAPVQGWDTVSGLAQMPPNRAVQMDNWIPRTGWIEIRRGYVTHCTGVGSATDPVETLMVYNTPAGASEVFAVAGLAFWDVTNVGAAVATSVTMLTNDRWQFCNFTNESDAQNYLVTANGVDTPQIYDGAAWANFSPTIPGYSADDVIQPHAHQGRLWCVLNNSNEVAYLPLGAIAGAATIFPLGSFMGRGGYVMAMASWTVDTRQTVSDYAVFITSVGQVIVFMGNDPDTNFTLVGVYDIGPPIGRRCYEKVAGDVAIISVDGILPLSQVLSTDRSAANRVSITNLIAGAMLQATNNYSTLFGWQLISYPKGNLAVLNIPQVENETSQQFVMETNTGGWCRFIGINANCWVTKEGSDNTIYFGGNDGTVYQFDVGSGDGDMAISAQVQTAFNYHGARGQLKNWGLIRPIITSDGSIKPGVGLNVDFGSGGFVSIPDAATNTGAVWDVSLWDVALWPLEGLTSAVWQTVSGTGQCCSVITSVQTLENGSADGVLLQLNGWDMAYEKGGLI